MNLGVRSSNWEFFNPVHIYSGVGALEKLPTTITLNEHVLLVTSAGTMQRGGDAILKLLRACAVFQFDQVTPNPELELFDNHLNRLRKQSFTKIVAVGGGSVLDVAKILSVLLPQGESLSLRDSLGKKIGFNGSNKIPLVAIPTTAGTGAEVTPFATVWDSSNHQKHSLTGQGLYPDLAILDPALTATLTGGNVLYPALDAISHSLESLWNVNRNLFSSIYALKALELSCSALPQILQKSLDLTARSALQQASMLSGLAISQTKTAIAHSISYPLTSHFGMPHGLACSFTLPKIIEMYLGECFESSDRFIMEKTGHLLKSFQLSELVAEYASENQIVSVCNEMYSPERAKNFLFPIGLTGIEGIVLESIKGA